MWMKMKDVDIKFWFLVVALASLVGLTGCGSTKADPQAEAPPPLKVERVEDRNLFQVEHPERFQLVQAAEHIAVPQLRVTGTVTPDILRSHLT